MVSASEIELIGRTVIHTTDSQWNAAYSNGGYLRHLTTDQHTAESSNYSMQLYALQCGLTLEI